jgi:hypothetical protein
VAFTDTFLPAVSEVVGGVANLLKSHDNVLKPGEGGVVVLIEVGKPLMVCLIGVAVDCEGMHSQLKLFECGLGRNGQRSDSDLLFERDGFLDVER